MSGRARGGLTFQLNRLDINSLLLKVSSEWRFSVRDCSRCLRGMMQLVDFVHSFSLFKSLLLHHVYFQRMLGMVDFRRREDHTA